MRGGEGTEMGVKDDKGRGRRWERIAREGDIIKIRVQCNNKREGNAKE